MPIRIVAFLVAISTSRWGNQGQPNLIVQIDSQVSYKVQVPGVLPTVNGPVNREV